jgi:ribosomal protein S18 acetylase RimI-like enzyme
LRCFCRLHLPGLYLEDLYVREEYRGQLAGRALLKAVARIAVQRGYRRLEWIVTDANRPAIEFYRSLGAAELSEQTAWRLSDQSLSRLAKE